MSLKSKSVVKHSFGLQTFVIYACVAVNMYMITWLISSIGAFPRRHVFKLHPSTYPGHPPSGNVSTNPSTYPSQANSDNGSDEVLPAAYKQWPILNKSNCYACFQQEFRSLIAPNTICKMRNRKETLDLLVVITTAHSHTFQRHALRSSWVTVAKNNTANVRYVFLLGTTRDKVLFEIVRNESFQHGDILMADFVDSYKNLTLKTLVAFHWARKYCSHARHIMKTDDDMFVNIPGLLRLLKQDQYSLQSAVGGACRPPHKRSQDQHSKYFAGYHRELVYPKYCSGTGYVTSMRVANDVTKMAASVPFLHLEDVFVGICLRKLGYHTQKLPGFFRKLNVTVIEMLKPKLNVEDTPEVCFNITDRVITQHHVNLKAMLTIWKLRCTGDPSKKTIYNV